ncbi:MAG TPA: hypothetical protein VHC22_01455 [Pirellulales bacterium]|nr:hypothetical protein [Pirellulales bacterium]
MRWFASLLNWNGLQLQWVRLDEEIIVSYVTTDIEFHIQINELRNHPGLHQATTGPFRYGIGPHVGWHRFELFDDDARLLAESQRLKPFLDRQQFRDPARRVLWKKAHPELLLKKRKQ